jgi:alcohol dehydrogenase
MVAKSPAFPSGKAAIFSKPGTSFEIVCRELPPIKSGEILVKTEFTTICGSDVHTFSGRRIEPSRVVLGHEIVGNIIWIDSEHPGVDLRGEPISIGDRITWSIFAVPTGSKSPRKDLPQKSAPLFKYGHALAEGDDVFNGGLAEYCILRKNTALIKLSGEIPAGTAATINCAHSTVAGALRVAGEISGKNVLVFGAGLLGLSCVAMCKEAGAEMVSITDYDEDRLRWGKPFGANQTFTYPGNNQANNLPWSKMDLVFDMTGSPDAMKSGIASLAIGGVAVWVGAVYPEKPVEVDAQVIVRNMLQIRGLYNYNYEDFLNATTFIEKNWQKYPFEGLVEREFTLDEVDDAFAFAAKNKPVRAGVRLNH